MDGVFLPAVRKSPGVNTLVQRHGGAQGAFVNDPKCPSFFCDLGGAWLFLKQPHSAALAGLEITV